VHFAIMRDILTKLMQHPYSGMRLLDLNADVLEHISSWILSIDIHAWRVSCKPLAAVSKPYRFRHVTLKGASAVRNFHAFLDRTSVGVFSVVLAFPDDITTVPMAHRQTLNQTLLPQLLIRAPGLRCLKVSGGGVDMSLLRHLVGCPRLEELGLPDMWEGMHPALFETLLTAALPLRILALPVYRHTHHVIALLQSCALTLETVECTGNLFDEQDPVVSCPKVHTLVLHLARHVVWTTLRAMFPAVRTLHVEGHLIPGQTAPSEADGGRRTAPGTRVDVLSGTVCGVHVLDNHGLQVSLLALDRCRGRGACTKPAAALSQVLAWARPEMLSVRLPLAAYDTALGLSPGAHGVVVLELILEAPHEPFDLMAGKPPPVRLGHLVRAGPMPPCLALTST
jgi:hypothetical protein